MLSIQSHSRYALLPSRLLPMISLALAIPCALTMSALALSSALSRLALAVSMATFLLLSALSNSDSPSALALRLLFSRFHSQQEVRDIIVATANRDSVIFFIDCLVVM